MRDSFGPSAARLSGIAAGLLGWRPDEFWDSTPMELSQALGTSISGEEPPEASVIDALRRRFPDD